MNGADPVPGPDRGSLGSAPGDRDDSTDPGSDRLDLLDAVDLYRAMGTDQVLGLEPGEAEDRLARRGRNELPPPARVHPATRFMRQLRDPMSVLLLVAAGISGIALGEAVDAVAILSIVILNALIGTVQEGRADRALEALRHLEARRATVVRGGTISRVAAAEVAWGEVVVIAAGDAVPADLRLVEANSLEVDEASLTGESLPAHKSSAAIVDRHAGIADRSWMAFSGTLVTRGNGRGLAIATGEGTVVGGLAAQLRERRELTPLQRQLGRLTGRLGVVALLVAALVFVLLMLRQGGDSIDQAFLASVALAVAAVPEGLPTVVTLTLALGVRRMAGEGAIVRRLPAVETLGSTTVLLTDKTGTLTENRMRLDVVGTLEGERTLEELEPGVAKWLSLVAALCSDAAVDPPEGDPVEIALLEAVGASLVSELRDRYPRVDELPFDSERKRMTTLHPADGEFLLLVKGAPEVVLAMCTTAITAAGDTVPLDLSDRSYLNQEVERLATTGSRVLALSERRVSRPPTSLDAAEEELSLVALVALADQPRPEAAAAVAEIEGAGIHLTMVTGDHAATAAAIAGAVGMTSGDPDRVVAGPELRDGSAPSDVASVRVFARMEPDQKLELVEAFNRAGHVVAVTGDGVNDAPALRKAAIGVAMGRTGSDVAREAADMVITDDNLATISTAIREGRGIYDNIRKVIDYLVAGNLSEILVVITGLIAFPGLGVPLFPLQLLLINLLTDGLPALALAFDATDSEVMRRAPRPRGAQLLSAKRLRVLGGRGALLAAGAIAALIAGRRLGFSLEEARTAMFGALVLGHLLYAYVARLPTKGLRSNPRLVGAVGLGIVLLATVMILPVGQLIFDTTPLPPLGWVVVALAGTLPVAVLALVTGRRNFPYAE
jgi:calcium-translocating P-type ATPase